MDINEARLFHLLLLSIVLYDSKSRAKLFTSFDKELAPLSHCRIIFDSIVITRDRGGSLVTLDPTPGLTAAKGLAEKSAPVFDATNQPSNVDIINRVGLECPLAGAVFNLTAIFWLVLS